VCGYSQAAARSSERIVKILNLYAGIGGNRKLWGDEHEVTAVEYKPEVAAIYGDLFPKDTVIVADAHQFLLDRYREFDFILVVAPVPISFESSLPEQSWLRILRTTSTADLSGYAALSRDNTLEALLQWKMVR